MKHSRKKSWMAAALAACLVLASVAAGGRTIDPANAARAKQKLAAVRARIAEIVSRRGAQLQKRDALSAALRRADLDITAQRRALDDLNSATLAAERRLSQLSGEMQRNVQALDRERSALAGEVAAAYMIGPREEVKMLLNQTDPGRLGRMLSYYGYFGRARAAEISAIRDRMQRLTALGRDAAQQTVRLKDLKEDSQRDLAGLVAARSARAAALAAAARQVKTSDQELGRLQREKRSVEALIADLSRIIKDFPADTQQSFERLRGRLAWPVSGRLIARYHQVRLNSPQGNLRWNGDLIESAKGAVVRAPYFGRVVYADWLQGMGLLTIIAHSGGYLSLYGHAEVLYKSVGDWVAPGDVIAAMSDAPGPPPRLYFEIRKGRVPVDPQSWFTGKP